jgi:putative ABC transport system permease protein
MPGRDPLWRRYARFVGGDVARDVDDELRFHFDQLVESGIAEGADVETARERARERMGDLGRVRSECERIDTRLVRRDRRALWSAGLRQDLRYAVRALRQAPLFTTVAALTLALGIGANTAAFSVVQGVVLRPLPYGEPDRLVALWEHNLPRNHPRNVANPENVRDWLARSRSFESAALYSWASIIFTGNDQAERVSGRGVTPNFFSVLRVRPMLGRNFVADDTAGAAGRIIMLSSGLWRRRFGGDSGIVGSKVGIAGGTATVAGVMPPGFRPMGDEEFWQPVWFGDPGGQRRGRYLMAVARLAAGATAPRAQVELRGIAQDLERAYPDFDTGWTVDVVPLRDDVVGDAGRKLFIVLGAVSLVLLIACANVGNLVLVRAAARQHEMAIRAALGAARARLTRLWLAECGLLTLAGVGLGLVVAWGCVRGLVALAPPDIPRLDAVRLDWPVFAFAAALAGAVTILLALGAALGTSARALGSLREAAGRQTSTRRARRFRGALVVGQVALALVLLQGAGLLTRTLLTLQQVSPGFDPDRIVTTDIVLPSALYRTPADWTRYFRHAVDELRAQPGVGDAGFVNAIPLTGIQYGTGFRALDRPEPPPGQLPVADIRVADQGYFHVLAIPLLRGRLLELRDDSLPYVMVNVTLAREMWPGEDPIGKRIRVQWYRPDQAETIVGVVGDTRSEGLDIPPRPTIYYSPEASPNAGYTIVARGAVGPATLISAVRGTLRRLDPVVPIRDVVPMDRIVNRSLAGRRSPAYLLSLFAALAMLLATIGLYGVLAYVVGLRRKEIGVRVALGARPGSVLWIIVKSGLALCGAGLLVGAVAAFAATRVLRGMLYDVSPSDPGTLAAVGGLLLAAALLASVIPGWRASRLDPTTVVRSE